MPSMYELIEKDGEKQYLINKQAIAEDRVPTNTKNVLTNENIVDEFGTIIVDRKLANTEDKNATPPETDKLPRVDGEDGGMVSSPDQPTPPPAQPEAPQGPAVPPTAPEVADPAATDQESTDDSDDEPSPPGEGDDVEKALPGEKGADEEVLLDDQEGNDLDLDDGADDILSDDEDLEDDPEDDNRDKAAPKVDTEEPPAGPDEDEPDKPAKKKPVPSRSRARKTTEDTKFKSKVPQSNPGMGFPRKNGKTSDIFDINVPHTQTKLVGGWAVPLSAESYNTRSEGEIMAKLIELGFEITDYNEIERKQNHSDAVGGNGLLMEDEEVDEDISLG